MKAFYLSLSLLAFYYTVRSQSVPTLMGARAAGMGYASASVKDEWSLFNNAGGIASIKTKSAAFAYEARPALAGANRMAAVFNVPLKPVVASMGVFRFGDELYSQQLLNIGVGSVIGNTSLGAKLNYIQYRAEGFGTQTAQSIDFGGITQLTPTLAIGSYIINLTQSRFHGNKNELLPTKLVAGVAFRLDDQVIVTSELEKDLDYQTFWRTGLEYSIYQKVFFRTGYNLNPQVGYFGIGFHKANLKIDYALSYTTINGAAHQASAIYVFPTKEKP